MDAQDAGGSMTEKANCILKAWFETYVDRFRDGAHVLCPPLELKLAHSLRVADNARLIADDLGLPGEERRLAEACGLVHDVGRFPQYAEFGSFRDADTVDHGAHGRRVLETQGRFPFFNKGDCEVLLDVVQYHNRRTSDIPAGRETRTAHLLGLIRDADKLDVMDLVLQSVAADGFQDLPTMLPQIRLSRDVSQRVLMEAAERQSVSIGNLATLGDYLVMLAVWFYDLNYPPSRRIAVERGIMDRIQRELPDKNVVRNLLDRIKAALPHDWPRHRKL